jgi:hypothetical protein
MVDIICINIQTQKERVKDITLNKRYKTKFCDCLNYFIINDRTKPQKVEKILFTRLR